MSRPPNASTKLMWYDQFVSWRVGREGEGGGWRKGRGRERDGGRRRAGN